MSDDSHSRQTLQLLDRLRDAGFVANHERFADYGMKPRDGLVEHPQLGIRVHADDEMVRIVVPGTESAPPYRLVLARYGLSSAQAITIIAVHARAAVTERS